MRAALSFLSDFVEAHLRLIALWFLAIFFATTLPAWLLIWVIGGCKREFWTFVFTLEFTRNT